MDSLPANQQKVLDLETLVPPPQHPQPQQQLSIPAIIITAADNMSASPARSQGEGDSDLSLLSHTPTAPSPSNKSSDSDLSILSHSPSIPSSPLSPRALMVQQRQRAPRHLDESTMSQLESAEQKMRKHTMTNAEALARLQVLVARGGELRARCKEIEDEKKRNLGFVVEGGDALAVKPPTTPSLAEGSEMVGEEKCEMGGEGDITMMSDYGVESSQAIASSSEASSPAPSTVSTTPTTKTKNSRAPPKTSTSSGVLTAKPVRNSKRDTNAKRSLALKQKREADAAAAARKAKLEADEKAFHNTKFKVTRKEYEEYQRMDAEIKDVAGEIKELEAYLLNGKWTGREKWANKIVESEVVENGLLAEDDNEGDELPARKEEAVVEGLLGGKAVGEEVDEKAVTPTSMKKVKGMAKKGGKRVLVPRSPETGDMTLVPLNGEDEGEKKIDDAVDYS